MTKPRTEKSIKRLQFFGRRGSQKALCLLVPVSGAILNFQKEVPFGFVTQSAVMNSKMSKKSDIEPENSKSFAKRRAIWRFLRDNGGYWTATELAAEFSLPRLSGTSEIAKELTQLKKAASVVERRADRYRNHSYGVTTTCIPFANETLEVQNVNPKRTKTYENHLRSIFDSVDMPLSR